MAGCFSVRLFWQRACAYAIGLGFSGMAQARCMNEQNKESSKNTRGLSGSRGSGYYAQESGYSSQHGVPDPDTLLHSLSSIGSDPGGINTPRSDPQQCETERKKLMEFSLGATACTGGDIERTDDLEHVATRHGILAQHDPTVSPNRDCEGGVSTNDASLRSLDRNINASIREIPNELSLDTLGSLTYSASRPSPVSERNLNPLSMPQVNWQNATLTTTAKSLASNQMVYGPHSAPPTAQHAQIPVIHHSATTPSFSVTASVAPSPVTGNSSTLVKQMHQQSTHVDTMTTVLNHLKCLLRSDLKLNEHEIQIFFSQSEEVVQLLYQLHHKFQPQRPRSLGSITQACSVMVDQFTSIPPQASINLSSNQPTVGQAVSISTGSHPTSRAISTTTPQGQIPHSTSQSRLETSSDTSSEVHQGSIVLYLPKKLLKMITLGLDNPDSAWTRLAEYHNISREVIHDIDDKAARAQASPSLSLLKSEEFENYRLCKLIADLEVIKKFSLLESLQKELLML